MSKRKSQQQLLMVEQEQPQQPLLPAPAVEPAPARRFTRAALKRQKLSDHDDDDKDDENNNNQQQHKQPLLPQPKQQKSQPQQQQQHHEQHQHQSYLPQADIVSDQTAHDMHNLLYSKTCCSNCTIQKQTCAFLQTISAEHQRLRRRKQHQSQQQSSPPTLLQSPSETSQPFRFAYEQEGREVDTTKLSFATRLNHTTLSTNRFLLNDIGNIFQQLLVLRDETLHNKLCNNFYSQHVRGYQAFRNVQLSIKINSPHTGDSSLLPQTFPADTTIDDVMQYLFYEQGRKEEQNQDNKEDDDNNNNHNNTSTAPVNNTIILKDIPTLPFHPYAMGLSLSKPSRPHNFNSRHAALSPYITTTSTATRNNKQNTQQCLPFFFTLYQCFDHDEQNHNNMMTDDNENDNNSDDENNNNPNTTALIPSNWKYPDVAATTTTTTTTTKSAKSTRSTKSQQNELKLSSYPTLLPLEFDLVYNNSNDNNSNNSNIDQFKNTTFYKELLQPVLAQKRTLKDIFIHGKAYQEEDDDGYTPERRMQNLPRENSHVELLYETTTTFDDLFLQNLNNNFNNFNKNNRNNTNNNNNIAMQLTQDYNNAQQQYENNMRVKMLKLQHLDQIKVDFVMSLCLGLRFEVKVMNAYMAHPGETLLALQQQQDQSQQHQQQSQQDQPQPPHQQNQPQQDQSQQRQQSSTSMNNGDRDEEEEEEQDENDEDEHDDDTTTPHINTSEEISHITFARREANAKYAQEFSAQDNTPYTLFCENRHGDMTQWSGDPNTTTWNDLLKDTAFFPIYTRPINPPITCDVRTELEQHHAGRDLNTLTLSELGFESGHLLFADFFSQEQLINVEFVGQDDVMTIKNIPSRTALRDLRYFVNMKQFQPTLSPDLLNNFPQFYHPNDDTASSSYPMSTLLSELILTSSKPPHKSTTKKNATILLKLAPSDIVRGDGCSMRIYIKTAMGKTITLDMKANDTIGAIQNQILKKEGIPPEQQRLIFGGKLLCADDYIDQHKIVDGSTIGLVLRLRGC